MKTQTFIRLLLASILLPLLWWQVATSTGACDPEFVVSEGVSCQTENAAEASPLLTLLGTVRPRFTLNYVDSVNTIPIGGLDPTLEARIRPAVPTATPAPSNTPTTTPTTPPGVTPATATNTPPTTPTTRAATNTPTPTPSVTPTTAPPTPTTPSQPGDGDRYETDDACAAAKPVTTDGIPQQRTFHAPGDIDWVRFDAQQDERYLIHVDVPNSSSADVALELRGICGGVTERAQDHAFSPGIRLEFDAPIAGPIHLRLTNHSPEIAGDHVTYTLSVRTLRQTAEPGALILVAGKIQDNDDVQPNIYHVTDTVYNLFLSQGYAPDDIYYLAPDLSRANVDGMATAENLQAAITQWAAERVDANHPLTIYLMDHGSSDTLFLDKQRGEWVTPDQLDSWLTTLETTICGSAENRCLPVNVIVEACYSGSFISMPGTVSRPGRVVVTSTDDRHLAWATDRGASFSDHFLRALAQGNSLYGSYMVARAAAAAFLPQQAWLDGDGDGNPHDDGSQTIAAQRGFTFRNGFDDIWQPYIKATALERTEDGRVHIRAQVLDDVTVDHVWAIIYAPSYRPPTEGDALVKETLTTVTLLDEGGGWFGAVSNEFTEAGRYQVLIHAEDNDDFAAPPVRVGWDNGSRIFLPLVVR